MLSVGEWIDKLDDGWLAGGSLDNITWCLRMYLVCFLSLCCDVGIVNCVGSFDNGVVGGVVDDVVNGVLR